MAKLNTPTLFTISSNYYNNVYITFAGNNSDNEVAFTVMISTDSEFSSAEEIVGVLRGSVEYLIKRLLESTQYYIKIKAVGDNVNTTDSDYSSVLNVTTPSKSVTPLATLKDSYYIVDKNDYLLSKIKFSKAVLNETFNIVDGNYIEFYVPQTLFSFNNIIFLTRTATIDNWVNADHLTLISLDSVSVGPYASRTTVTDDFNRTHFRMIVSNSGTELIYQYKKEGGWINLSTDTIDTQTPYNIHINMNGYYKIIEGLKIFNQ